MGSTRILSSKNDPVFARYCRSESNPKDVKTNRGVGSLKSLLNREADRTRIGDIEESDKPPLQVDDLGATQKLQVTYHLISSRQ